MIPPSWVLEDEDDETDEVERASEADTDKVDQFDEEDSLEIRSRRFWVRRWNGYSVHHRCWKMNLQKTNWTRRRTWPNGRRICRRPTLNRRTGIRLRVAIPDQTVTLGPWALVALLLVGILTFMV